MTEHLVRSGPLRPGPPTARGSSVSTDTFAWGQCTAQLLHGQQLVVYCLTQHARRNHRLTRQQPRVDRIPMRRATIISTYFTTLAAAGLVIGANLPGGHPYAAPPASPPQASSIPSGSAAPEPSATAKTNHPTEMPGDPSTPATARTATARTTPVTSPTLAVAGRPAPDTKAPPTDDAPVQDDPAEPAPAASTPAPVTPAPDPAPETTPPAYTPVEPTPDNPAPRPACPDGCP